MSATELKKELIKRELNCAGTKDSMKHRLNEFLLTPECLQHQMRQNEKLIKGFMREFCKKNKMNVPICLQNAPVSFYPTITL